MLIKEAFSLYDFWFLKLIAVSQKPTAKQHANFMLIKEAFSLYDICNS